MTNTDKKLIGDYMGWRTRTHVAHVFNMHEDFTFTTCDNGLRNIYFDLNAAGACVNEMQRRKNWVAFHRFTVDKYSKDCFLQAGFTAWLYDADNFFTAMATWLKEKKG